MLLRLLPQRYPSAFADNERRLWLRLLLRLLPLVTVMATLPVTWKVMGLCLHYGSPGCVFLLIRLLLLQS